MKNLLRFLAKEQIYSASSDGLKKKMMVRLEWKLMWLMINLASKFFRATELVLETYVFTLATIQACLKRTQHYWCACCKEDTVCFQDAIFLLPNVYTEQFFCLKSDLIGSKQTFEESRVFVKKMNTLELARGFIAGLCEPDLLLERYFQCIHCITLTLVTRMNVVLNFTAFPCVILL